jgi:hypothetical protein
MLQHALATLSLPFYTHRERITRITTHIGLPVVALGFIAFAIFSTVYPIPAFPLNLPAYMVIAWILVGALVLSMVRTRKGGKSSSSA